MNTPCPVHELQTQTQGGTESSMKHFLMTPPHIVLYFYQDGVERWRRWDELLQLVWMLMLSYQEVITGRKLLFLILPFS